MMSDEHDRERLAAEDVKMGSKDPPPSHGQVKRRRPEPNATANDDEVAQEPDMQSTVDTGRLAVIPEGG